ncbi:Dystonin, partial [Araneus ventricosus]
MMNIDKALEKCGDVNLYSSIAEKSSSFEETNALGARYIREAKIYDLRLKHYKENLEEEHPSLDASLQKSTTVISGADAVERELDLLNHQYSTLMQTILDYLEELKEAFTVQQREKWLSIISNAAPVSLRTFTSFINQVPSTDQLVSEFEIHLKQTESLPVQTRYSEITDTSFSLLAKEENNLPEIEKTLDSKKRASSVCDSLEYKCICEVKGIYNPILERMVSLHEAVEQNIVNCENKQITDLRTGRRMSLDEAVAKGFIDRILHNNIVTKCGIYFPGTKEELSIIDAMQKGLFDCKKGTLLNPQDERPVTLTDAFHLGIIKKSGMKNLVDKKIIKTKNLSISEAIEREFLDPKSGLFREPLTNHTIEFKAAVSQGYINLTSTTDVSCGITLADAVDRNMIHNQSGQILDQDSGEKYTTDEAITKGILRSDVPEIVDVKKCELLNLNQAFKIGILNAQSGRFIDSDTLKQYSFSDARKQNFIWKPLTLKDAFENGLIKNDCIKNPITGEFLSILEALSCGILDCELKCIVDPELNELLSLPEALCRGIILPNGTYFEVGSNRHLTLSSAIEDGLITSVMHKTIFDVEGIKDEKTNEMVTFNMALDRNIIDLNQGVFKNNVTGVCCTLEEAVSKGLIQHQIYDMLCKPIGIMDGTKELNLIEACEKGYIDSRTGHLRDPKSKKVFYMKEAIEKGIITHEGAALLKGLLNITVTMASVTRSITRYVDSLNGIEQDVDSAVAQNIIDDILKKDADTISKLSAELEIIPEMDVSGRDSQTKHPVLSSDGNTVLESHKNSESRVSSKYFGTLRNDAVDSDYNNTSVCSMRISSPVSENISTQMNNTVITSHLSDSLLEKSTKVQNIDMGNNLVQNQTSLSVQVLELPPDGWYLQDAINKKLFDPQTGLFTVPGTDRLVSFEETVKMEIINPKSASIVVPKTKQTVSLDSALEMKILDSTGCYNNKTGGKISMQKAIDKKLIIFLESIQNQKDTSMFHDDTSVENSGYHISMEGTETRHSEVVSKLPVKSGFWPEQKCIILQKMPKKVVSPNDAATDGLIDFETAQLLNALSDKITSEKHSPLPVDEKCGKIPDYRKGVFVSIREAFDLRFIDKDTGKLLIPIGRSLSIDEAFNQGLINELSNKVIHPESGSELTIEEGIMCDIINPLSFCIDPITLSEITLSDAVQKGIIDSSTGEITSSSGKISLIEAVNKNLFKTVEYPFKCPPMLALTFPTALQLGRIDVEKKEYILPHSNKRIPIQKAFESSELLAIPVQPQREYFLLDDALNKKLIDPKSCTFQHPVTGVITGVREAVQSGLLVMKPVRLTSISSSILTQIETTEKEFFITKDDDVLDGYSFSDLINNTCGMPFYTAIIEGCVNLDSGLFHDKTSNKTYTITDALRLQLLQPFSMVENINDKYSLSRTFLHLFDDKTEKIIIPDSQFPVSFEFLVENGYISVDSLLYIIGDRVVITLKDALNENIIDVKTGCYVERSSGDLINMKNAARLGYLAFIDVPVLPTSNFPSDIEPSSVDSTSKKTVVHRPTSLPLDSNILDQKTPVSLNISSGMKKVSDDSRKKISESKYMKPGNDDSKVQKDAPETYSSKRPGMGRNLLDSDSAVPKTKVSAMESSESRNFAKGNIDAKSGIHKSLLSPSRSKSPTKNKNKIESSMKSYEPESKADTQTSKQYENVEPSVPSTEFAKSNIQVDKIETAHTMPGVLSKAPNRRSTSPTKIATNGKTQNLPSNKNLSEKEESPSINNEYVSKSIKFQSKAFVSSLTEMSSNITVTDSEKISAVTRTSKELSSVTDKSTHSEDLSFNSKEDKIAEIIMSSSTDDISVKSEHECVMHDSTEIDMKIASSKHKDIPVPKEKYFQQDNILNNEEEVDQSLRRESKIPVKDRVSPSTAVHVTKDSDDNETLCQSSAVRESETRNTYEKVCMDVDEYSYSVERIDESSDKEPVIQKDENLPKEIKSKPIRTENVPKESESPTKETRSSFKKDKPSSIKLSVRKTEISTREMKSPLKDLPVEQTELPVRKTKSPSRELPFKQARPSSSREILVKESISLKEIESPSNESKSPQRESITLLEEVHFRGTDSSVHETERTSDDIKSATTVLRREIGSPTQVDKSPSKELPSHQTPSLIIELPMKSPLQETNEIKFTPAKIKAPPKELPVGKSESPSKYTELPSNERKVSNKESKPRTREIKSPEKESKSPERRIKSQPSERKSPARDTSSANETKSPREIKFPEKGVKSSPREIKSPESSKPSELESKSPSLEVKLPKTERHSPTKEINSPEKGSKFPEREIQMPEKGSKSPVREIISTEKEIIPLAREIKPSEKEIESLVSDIKSPIKGSESPVRDIEFSEEGSKSRVRDIESPKKESKSPVRDIESPKKESKSPVRDIESPKKGSISPVRDVESPKKEIKSPLKDIESPKKESISPVRDVESPKKESMSLVRDSVSPKKGSKSPVRDIESPEKGSKSLVRDFEFLETESKSPVKRAKSPQKESKSPICVLGSQAKESRLSERDIKSPEKESKSPIKEIKSPQRESKSPVKEIKSPEKESTLPDKERRSPVREIKFPGKESKSPMREIKSPKKESKSPARELKSPDKEDKLPARDIKSPEKGIKSPAREIKVPEKEMKPSTRKDKSPEKDTKSLEKDTKSPTREIETPEKETKSPTREVKSPEKESYSPVGGVISPEKESESPAREAKSPEKESKLPKREIGTLEKESKSPTREVTSPERGSIAPIREVKPPEKDDKVLVREIKSPESKLPKREIETLEKESKSPSTDVKSLERESKSPTREVKSPERESYSPVRGVTYPGRKSISPTREVTSLERENIEVKFPEEDGKALVREIKSTERESKLPKREIETLEKEKKSPTREVKSPERESKSPTRETKSPERESYSPARGVTAPERESMSLVREVKSPEKDDKTLAKEIDSPERESKLSKREIESFENESKSPAREVKSPGRESKSPMREVKSPERES